MRRLKYLRHSFRFLFDPQVPFRKKTWIIIVLLYLISPLDLIPDLIPGFGFLDDLVIIILSLSKLIQVLEEYDLTLQNRRSNNDSGTSGPTIDDVEYKVHRD